MERQLLSKSNENENLKQQMQAQQKIITDLQERNAQLETKLQEYETKVLNQRKHIDRVENSCTGMKDVINNQHALRDNIINYLKSFCDEQGMCYDPSYD